MWYSAQQTQLRKQQESEQSVARQHAEVKSEAADIINLMITNAVQASERASILDVVRQAEEIAPLDPRADEVEPEDDDTQDEADEVEPEAKPYPCPLCPSTSVSEVMLALHMTTHPSMKATHMRQCYCGHMAKDDDALNGHIHEAHFEGMMIDEDTEDAESFEVID